MSNEKKMNVDLKNLASKAGKATAEAAQSIGKGASAVADKTKELTDKSQQAVFAAIDQNGDGKFGIEDVIIMGLKVPGVRVDREQFLQKELQMKVSQKVIDDAIAYNPMHAKIPSELIDKIADEVIKYERNCVSGISAALGVAGGFTMVATVPADIAQYYGYMLRVAQKLMYLYGFPAIDLEEKGQSFDSQTMNTLIICLGVMYGVAGANKALKEMAKALASGVEKKLLNKALTKGMIYPIVKSVAYWFDVKMTKEVFAGFVKKAIPVVGGVLGGGLTFASFKPCCDKLRDTLKDTILSNPDYCSLYEDDDLIVGDGAVVIDAEVIGEECLNEE